MYPTNISHWIDDREVAGSSGASFEKRSPIDDRVIAQVARGNAADARAAVDAAERAAASWSRLTPPRRGEILGRAAEGGGLLQIPMDHLDRGAGGESLLRRAAIERERDRRLVLQDADRDLEGGEEGPERPADGSGRAREKNALRPIGRSHGGGQEVYHSSKRRVAWRGSNAPPVSLILHVPRARRDALCMNTAG